MLSEIQRQSLNRAVCDYVRQNGGSPQLLSQLESLLPGPDASHKQDTQLLERKWNSIVRLQSRIMELEKQCSSSSSNSTTNDSQQTIDNANANWIPKEKPSFQITLEAPVTALCLHPTLPIIYVGLESGKLLRYDILNVELPLQSTMAHLDAITSISVSLPNTNNNNSSSSSRPAYLATTSKDLNCKIWELDRDSSLTHIRTLVGHEHTVSECQFFEKDSDLYLATCSRDLSVKIWDTSNGWCIKSFQPHTQWVRTLHVRGEYILTGSNDSALRLTHWPSGNGLSMGIGHEFPVETVRILAQNANDILPQYQPLGFQYVSSASRDGTIRIWKVSLPKFIPHRPPRPNPMDTNFRLMAVLKGHKSWVRHLCQFNNKLYSCSDDGSIKCWELNWPDISSTTCTKTWDLSENGFQNCLALDNIDFTNYPSRKLLFSGSNNGTLTCFMR